MLDYRFIKENLEAVKKNIIDRNMDPSKADADLVVKLFDEGLSDLVQIFQCASLLVLDVYLKSAAGTIARNHTSGIYHDVCR